MTRIGSVRPLLRTKYQGLYLSQNEAFMFHGGGRSSWRITCQEGELIDWMKASGLAAISFATLKDATRALEAQIVADGLVVPARSRTVRFSAPAENGRHISRCQHWKLIRTPRGAARYELRAHSSDMRAKVACILSKQPDLTSLLDDFAGYPVATLRDAQIEAELLEGVFLLSTLLEE